MLICIKTRAQDTREWSFWAPNNVFGRQFVPKSVRRVLVNDDFHRKLVSVQVRSLLANCTFHRHWVSAQDLVRTGSLLMNCIFESAKTQIPVANARFLLS